MLNWSVIYFQWAIILASWFIHNSAFQLCWSVQHYNFSSNVSFSFLSKQHGSVYWKKGAETILNNLKPEQPLHQQLKVNHFLFVVPNWKTFIEKKIFLSQYSSSTALAAWILSVRMIYSKNKFITNFFNWVLFKVISLHKKVAEMLKKW